MIFLDTSICIDILNGNESLEIEIFDCIIASVVLSNGFSQILTKNHRHFNRIEGLEILRIGG